MTSSTICARATGFGHTAIGVFRLSGLDALEICNSLLSQPLSARHARKMCYRQIRDIETGTVIDDVLLCYYLAPSSYTGEDIVEFFCHGNPYILENIEQQCLKNGAVLAEPGEFTRRAFVNGRMDLSQAEAVSDIIESKGAAALSNARRLFEGELSTEISYIRDQLLSVIADFEAGIDFSDDIDDPIDHQRIDAELDHARQRLDRLVNSYDRGCRLSTLTVGIVGKVNAGKSTLLNLLLGRERAIVSDQEGTTRDYIEAECTIGPYSVRLVDTAGHRLAAQMDNVERKGYELGRKHVQQADVIVNVVDISAHVKSDTSLAGDIVVINKMDLARNLRIKQHGTQTDCDQLVAIRETVSQECVVIETSLVADRDRAAADLLSAIESCLDQLLHNSEAVFITQQRQFDALCRCIKNLDLLSTERQCEQVPELLAEHVREALHCLGEITGDTYTEQVLDTVFSRFCVGK